MISTPAEDDDVWAAAEAMSKRLNVPLSRLVAQAVREYGPVAGYLQAVADMTELDAERVAVGG